MIRQRIGLVAGLICVLALVACGGENEATPKLGATSKVSDNAPTPVTSPRSLYVTSYGGNSVEAIDLETLKVTNRSMGRDFTDVSCDGDEIWTLDFRNMAALKLSADLSRIETEVLFGSPPPSRIVAQGSELWVVDMMSGAYRIDTVSGTHKEIHIRDEGLAYFLVGIAVVNDHIWVAGRGGPQKALLQVDSSSGEVTRRIDLGEGSEIALAIGKKAQVTGAFGAVFVGGSQGGIVKLDPTSGKTMCTYAVEGEVTALAVIDHFAATGPGRLLAAPGRAQAV